MKLTKLKLIESELIRTHEKLKEAIKVAQNDDRHWWDDVAKQWENIADKPLEMRECSYCKEASAFKRAAMDLKRILANL